jgi:hypothetical protein
VKRGHVFEGLSLSAALVAVFVVGAWALTRPVAHKAPATAHPATVADPLVYRRKGNLRLVRAVWQGQLFLLLFEHRGGVWFFEGARLASEIKS